MKNYFDRHPITSWKIASEVEHIFLGTIEKRERWERIKLKNEPIMLASTPKVPFFKINLN